MDPIPFINLTTKPDADLERLRLSLTSLPTLEDVLQWAREQSELRGSEDFVTQDEFTHDGIFPLPSGDYAVFGLT